MTSTQALVDNTPVQSLLQAQIENCIFRTASPFTQSMGLQAIGQCSHPQLGSAPSTVEFLAPQSNESMNALPQPLPPARTPTQHRDFRDCLELYGLDPKAEWWILDPIHETAPEYGQTPHGDVVQQRRHGYVEQTYSLELQHSKSRCKLAPKEACPGL